MSTPAFEIPGVFTCTYESTAKAVVGSWHTFQTDKVSDAVTRHAQAGRRFGARTCIVDVSGVRGVPAPEDAAWIEKNGHPLVQQGGMVAVVNVVPGSAIVKMGADRWARAATQKGMQTFTTNSLEDALELARRIAAGETV